MWGSRQSACVTVLKPPLAAGAERLRGRADVHMANSTCGLHCVALGWTHAWSRPSGPMRRPPSYVKHISTAIPSTEEETEAQRNHLSKVEGAEPRVRPRSPGPSDVSQKTDSAGWGEEGNSGIPSS